MTKSEFYAPFRYKTNRSSPTAWLVSHVLHHWFVFVVAMLGAVGNAVMASFPVVEYGKVFAELTSGNPSLQAILRSAVIIGLTQSIRGVFQFARNMGFEVTAQRMEAAVREEFYLSLLGKSMTFHFLQSIGDLMARATNDIREINYLFSPGINMVFGSANFLVLPIILGYRVHPQLVLIPVLFVILYFIFLAVYIRALKPITHEVRSSFGAMNSRLAEDIDGVETVKAAAQEESEIQLFKKNAEAYRDAMVKQGEAEAMFIPLLLLSMALGFGLLHALILYNQGAIPLSNVLSYFSAIALLQFPTNTSIRAYSQISLGIASARRLLNVMNTETDLDQNEAGHAEVIEGDVQFENVSFSYEPDSQTLENISFHIKPGQTVAIVGQTGSGKTTLARMINRTYDPTSGTIKIDGHDLRDWQLASLRNQISIIEQDIFLFSKSVRQNIAFGKPEALDDEVELAANKAQATTFILELDEQFDTTIGERGSTLSGGQRQRLALARAFLTDPKILILDDSTSAIDSKTEDEIQKAIQMAAKGRTTFIITHRLSQIRWADVIIVMKKGHINAIGTHEELMAQSAAYRNIFTEV
ncbi:MAG: ABC transporter ATP-binding protein [Anaerolineaceae bacterium]|jgi:ATP-binding cassette subfamily B protein